MKRNNIFETASRNLTRVMIFVTFLCFVASIWLGYYQVRFLLGAIFWFVFMIVLVALLSTKENK